MNDDAASNEVYILLSCGFIFVSGGFLVEIKIIKFMRMIP